MYKRKKYSNDSKVISFVAIWDGDDDHATHAGQTTAFANASAFNRLDQHAIMISAHSKAYCFANLDGLRSWWQICK